MRITSVDIGNFRKLKSVRLELSSEKTLLVGANNSGKTSAMKALQLFLTKNGKNNFAFTDFSLCYWDEIDNIGISWEKREETAADIADFCPFLDIWLEANESEAYKVKDIIPSLDWEEGYLGLRCRFEPKDRNSLKASYVEKRETIMKLKKGNTLSLSPKNLSDFLQTERKNKQTELNNKFDIKFYVLDPDAYADKAQKLPPNSDPLENSPLKRLIKIDKINAQRGFDDTEGNESSKQLSDQLIEYYNKHLSPGKNPTEKDIEALEAIKGAENTFHEQIEEAFKEALNELRTMGYPGFMNPNIVFAPQFKPIDGLNHSTSVQYQTGAAVSHTLPENSNGLGYQNLISMIFRLMSFRDGWMRVNKAKSDTGAEQDSVEPIHLVLIEEPEAHLHTQAQQVFIRRAYNILRNHADLREDNRFTTHMIVSTHSVHITHECDFAELSYFKRDNNAQMPASEIVTLKDVFGRDQETKRFVRRYLRAAHCDLLFADIAILIEGNAERIVLPFLLDEATELNVLREAYICWLEINGSHAHRLRPLIEIIGIPTLIITDIDAKKDGKKAIFPKKDNGQETGNPTLTKWLPQKMDLDSLWALKSSEKIKNSVRIAYQTPIEIQFKGKYETVLGNSFEDAFIFENFAFFQADTEGDFKFVSEKINQSSDLTDLQTKIVSLFKGKDKSEFALNLLSIESLKGIDIPYYIYEGLQWIKDIIEKRGDMHLNNSEKAL